MTTLVHNPQLTKSANSLIFASIDFLNNIIDNTHNGQHIQYINTAIEILEMSVAVLTVPHLQPKEQVFLLKGMENLLNQLPTPCEEYTTDSIHIATMFLKNYLNENTN